MSIPVIVEESNGKFFASVPGAPGVRVEGATKSAALTAVREVLNASVNSGQLIFVELEPPDLLSLAGKYKDDDSWREIVEEAYRYRDELKRQEFGE